MTLYKTPERIIDGRARSAVSVDFMLPTRGAIDALKPGDAVKIGVEFDPQPGPRGLRGPQHVTGERFWVCIEEVNHAGDQFKGYVDNDLLFTRVHGLKVDDKVAFCRRHILDIEGPTDA